jgi:hypothetical protein
MKPRDVFLTSENQNREDREEKLGRETPSMGAFDARVFFSFQHFLSVFTFLYGWYQGSSS